MNGVQITKKKYIQMLRKYRKKKDELQQLYNDLVRLGAIAGLDDGFNEIPVNYEFPEQFLYGMIEKRGGEDMTTKEYIQELENDAKRLEIREMIEDDPCEKVSIRKKKNSSLKLLNAVRKWCGGKVNYATVDLDSVERR